jgi:sulfate adenylyltransferase subunit 1 (EFTu-like GTPase family)
MSVTLTLEDEIDVGRGDLIAVGAPAITRRFAADLVWMDERALEPSRLYLLKQTTRTVTAEVDHALGLNQIERVTVSTGRPIVCDPYPQNRATGSFILIDPTTNFTSGMIVDPVREEAGPAERSSAAERIAALARAAATPAEAAEAVRRALEELLA